MNEKNFDFLASQLKYIGFGETLQPALKVQLVQLTEEFVLYYATEFGKDSLVATLHFRRSAGSDLYFFDRYNVLLKNEHHPEPVKQAFYVSVKEDNISLHEAYNLMCGRAVQKTLTSKEGGKGAGWVQLDFKEVDKHGNFKLRQFHTAYGYDLEKVLMEYPIRELQQETDKRRLLESLQRGNRQQVHLRYAGTSQRVFIEASPQFKSLNWYDERQKKTTATNKAINRRQASTVAYD